MKPRAAEGAVAIQEMVRRVRRDRLAERGIRWFPQLLKVKGRVVDYEGEEDDLRELIGDAPGPREANLAPSYQGRTCWAGVDYFTVDKDGRAWSCRTAKRGGDGLLAARRVLAGLAPRRAPPARRDAP